MKKQLHLSLYILALLVFSAGARAQSTESFKVLAVNGQVQVQHPGHTDWVRVVTGNKLFPGDKLKVMEGGYLGLMHKTGRTLEVKKAVNLNISEVDQQINSTSQSSGEKFATFVINELGKVDKPANLGKYHQDHMTLTGAVERGSDEESLFSVIPRNTHLSNTRVKFQWREQAPAKAGNYKFVLADRFGKEIVSREVAASELELDLSELGLEKEICYFWTVSTDKESSSPEQCLYLLADDKREMIENQATVIRAEMTEPSAINQIVLAGFYEDQQLYLEARNAYEEAVKMEPQVDDYKKMYALFLTRWGMVEEASRIWRDSAVTDPDRTPEK